MKQLEVQIMGQSYLLGSPEGGEARLLDAVQRVDSAMCRIRDAGKIKARDRIAVLAALNLAFDLAERPEAPVKAPPASAAAIGATAATGSSTDAGADPRLGSLLQRLDNALGGDGHLL
ncbi:MAG TPA: cell division protein ZapA [Burkholderiaceae bacterium]|nr:cell division protein ZapA [Burkholderiaceae bacterium]